MNEDSSPAPYEHLKDAAHQFRYPPTPDVAGAVAERLTSGSRPRVRNQTAWATAALLVLAMTVLFAVPGVRAEIIHLFQVGVVRILPNEPAPTDISPSTATPRPASPGEPLYAITMADIAGETNLADAQARVPFPIRLPKHPDDLGKPDRVFLQEDGALVILVWTDPADPQQARLSLHQIGPGGVAIEKYEPRVILETQVNAQYAVWVQGPYLVQLTNGTYNFRRLVEGNTLIWEDGGITFRLESNLSLEETVEIAESLR